MKIKIKLPVRSGRPPLHPHVDGRAGNDITHLAQKNRGLLEGYVQPNANPAAIVHALRHESLRASSLSLEWKSLALPESLLAFASRAGQKCGSAFERSLKRPRHEGAASSEIAISQAAEVDEEVHPQAKRPCREIMQSDLHAASPCAVPEPSPSCPAAEAAANPSPSQPDSMECPAQLQHEADPCSFQPAIQPRSSEQAASDQATLTAVNLPDSPDQGACCQNSRVDSSNAACQAGAGMLLPPSCLSHAALRNGTAAAKSTLSPFSLSMPLRPQQSASHIDEKSISAMLMKAKELKHAADSERGGHSAQWTLRALVKYLESALQFMEACNCMTRASHHVHDRSGR